MAVPICCAGGEGTGHRHRSWPLGGLARGRRSARSAAGQDTRQPARDPNRRLRPGLRPEPARRPQLVGVRSVEVAFRRQRTHPEGACFVHRHGHHRSRLRRTTPGPAGIPLRPQRRRLRRQQRDGRLAQQRHEPHRRPHRRRHRRDALARVHRHDRREGPRGRRRDRHLRPDPAVGRRRARPRRRHRRDDHDLAPAPQGAPRRARVDDLSRHDRRGRPSHPREGGPDRGQRLPPGLQPRAGRPGQPDVRHRQHAQGRRRPHARSRPRSRPRSTAGSSTPSCRPRARARPR